MTLDHQFWLFVIGIIALVVVLTWLIYWVYRASVLAREERRLMIERGITPPTPQLTSWPAVKAREQELRFEERRLRIEKGLDPDCLGELTRSPEYYLRRGLASLFIGLGVGVAYVMLRLNLELATSETRNWLLALSIASPVVTLYGVACLLFYRATKDRAREATR